MNVSPIVMITVCPAVFHVCSLNIQHVRRMLLLLEGFGHLFGATWLLNSGVLTAGETEVVEAEAPKFTPCLMVSRIQAAL